MTPDQLQVIRARCEAATPAPWHWWHTKSNVSLACPKHGLLIVMDAVREGMNSAIMRFARRDHKDKGGVLRKASAFLPEYKFRDPEFHEDSENPDMNFIAHARTDLPALLDYIAELEKRIAKYVERTRLLIGDTTNTAETEALP